MKAHTKEQDSTSWGLVVALMLLLLPSLAGAEEARETSEKGIRNELGYLIEVDAGFQYADFKGLRGATWSVLFGLPYHRSRDVRAYLEAGLQDVMGDQAGLPSSRLIIGSRIAWLWDQISVHLDGHFGYGDRNRTARGTLIDGGLIDLGVAAYYDLFEQEGGGKLSLGLFVSGTLHRTARADEDSFNFDAVTGRGGLAFVIW